MRTVIFDLDGTLADTSGDLLAAANHCFRALGHGDLLAGPQDAGTALKGGRAMLRLGFERLGHGVAEAEIDAQYPLLLAAYDAHIDRHTVLYPGARAAVSRLRAAGWRLGVCTNKPEALAEKLLKRLKFRDVFDALIGADTLPMRKPDPKAYVETVRRAGGDVAQSVLIGDTRTDHDTARAAGVPSVLVCFGPGDEDVAALDADAYLDHFDDLAAIVEDLIG